MLMSDPKARGKLGDIQGNGIIPANDDANASEISRSVVIQDSEKDNPTNDPAQR